MDKNEMLKVFSLQRQKQFLTESYPQDCYKSGSLYTWFPLSKDCDFILEDGKPQRILTKIWDTANYRSIPWDKLTADEQKIALDKSQSTRKLEGNRGKEWGEFIYSPQPVPQLYP